MSRRGNCYDNAVAESFFSGLKKERVRKKIYKTRDEARAEIFDYIEVFYNRTRRHSHLGGMSPEAFERHHATRSRCLQDHGKSIPKVYVSTKAGQAHLTDFQLSFSSTSSCSAIIQHTTSSKCRAILARTRI